MPLNGWKSPVLAQRTRLFPGDVGEISLTFRNPTWIPLAWLSGYEHLPVALESGRLAVGDFPWAAGTASLPVIPLQAPRGGYTVGLFGHISSRATGPLSILPYLKDCP